MRIVLQLFAYNRLDNSEKEFIFTPFRKVKPGFRQPPQLVPGCFFWGIAPETHDRKKMTDD